MVGAKALKWRYLKLADVPLGCITHPAVLKHSDAELLKSGQKWR
jgi:hypothetical protein